MNIFAHFQAGVLNTLTAMENVGELPAGLDRSRVTVEPPRDPIYGDVTTNVSMVLAKPANLSPRALADKLLPHLKALDGVAQVSVAGPGFINMRLDPAFWPKVLKSVLEQGDQFGSSTIGANKSVHCEYVSANPTGPLHVGHCRGAVFGDALAALLEFAGYKVAREYYINDAGAQVDILARSVYLRYVEVLGDTIGDIPPGFYPGDYLKPVGAALAEKYGPELKSRTEAEWLPLIRAFAIEQMMELIRQDLASLNIKHDVYFSERSLYTSRAVEKTVAQLTARGLVYKGRLPPPKGEVPEDWDDREQTLFKSTNFGDDIDRPLRKSDESFTYFASDVAYSNDKISRGFNELIYVLGADHGGYVKRLQAVGAALADNMRVDVIVRLCQLVKLFRNGEPVRMSKRAGEFVTLRDVVDEVGPDVVRFMMLYRKNEAPLDFDFAKVTEQSKDNPVFYVQYAHARICSVLRNANEAGITPAASETARFDLLADEAEMAMIRRVAEFPRLIEAAAVAHEPHRISFYLFEIASEFHSLWNKGKESPQLRFIIEGEDALTKSRLAFLLAIRYCLANGLRVLGVNPMTEM